MAVWLSMSMSYVGPGDTANRSKVAVRVTVHWSSVSYNRYNPPVTVSIDGTSDTEYVSFNTDETGSGSEIIYNKYWDLGYDSSGSARTAYGSASYETGTQSGKVTASASVSLPAIGGSGGGGDFGDDDDDSGGGNTGGDSGGDDDDDDDNPGGSSDAYYDVFFELTNATMSVSLLSGSKVAGRYKSGSVIKIVVTPDDGYEFASCYINGESRTSATVSVNGDVYVEAFAKLDDSGDDDGGDPEGGDGGDPEGGGGGDGGDPEGGDGDDPEGGDGGSDYTEPFTFRIFEGKGTKVIINKWLIESDPLLFDVALTVDSQDGSGTWYKFDVYSGDFFAIDAEPLSGYEINTCDYIDSGITYTFNFEQSGLHYYEGRDKWVFSASDNVDPYVYARATKTDLCDDIAFCIDNGFGYIEYACCIDNGTTWDEYKARIDTDTGREPNT